MHVWPHYFSRLSHKGHPCFCVGEIHCTHELLFYLTSPQHWTILTTPFRKPFLPVRSGSPNLCPPHLRGSLLLLLLPQEEVLLEVLSIHSSIPLDGGPIDLTGFIITFLLGPETLSPDHHLLPAAISPSTLSSKAGTWLILCSPLSSSSPLFPSQSALSIDFSLFSCF